MLMKCIFIKRKNIVEEEEHNQVDFIVYCSLLQSVPEKYVPLEDGGTSAKGTFSGIYLIEI